MQGATLPGFSTGQAIAAMEKIAAETLPPGFGFEWTELALQEKLAGNTGLLIFAASVVFVFLLLAAQYESWTLPLAVILIVPMCLLAAVTGLLLRGMDVNVLAQIGFVVLIGLAAKNAILIVEFARQGEAEGLEPARGRGRRGADAAAADPDDLVRLHLRRGAAGHRDGRRRRDAPVARHRGLLRHDRRDCLRPYLHAAFLHGLPSAWNIAPASCRCADKLKPSRTKPPPRILGLLAKWLAAKSRDKRLTSILAPLRVGGSAV